MISRGRVLFAQLIINLTYTNTGLAHALPLIPGIACLLGVGIYGEIWYQGTLVETEILVAFKLISMGL